MCDQVPPQFSNNKYMYTVGPCCLLGGHTVGPFCLLGGHTVENFEYQDEVESRLIHVICDRFVFRSISPRFVFLLDPKSGRFERFVSKSERF